MASKPTTSRRLEVRKAIPRKRGLLSQAFRGEVVCGVALIAVFLIVAGQIVRKGRSEPSYRPGQLVDRTVISRVAFTSLDPSRTDEMRRTASELEPSVYALNEQFIDNTTTRLKSLPTVAASVAFENLAEDVQKPFGLTREAYTALKEYQADGQPTAQWTVWVDGFASALTQDVVLLEEQRYQIEKQNMARWINVAGLNREIGDFRIFNISDEAQVRRALKDQLDRFPAPLRDALINFVVRSNESTHRFDAKATEQAKAAAAKNVPEQETRYEPNSVLIPAGAQVIPDGYQLLLKEDQAYRASLPAWAWLAHNTGPVALLILITMTIVASIGMLRPRVLADPIQGAKIVVLMLGTLALAWVSRPLSPFGTAASAISPAVLTAIILTIAYDRRLGTVIASLLALLIAMALKLNLSLFIVTVFACVLACVQLGEVRKRGRLIRAATLTGLGVAAAVWLIGVATRQVHPGTETAVGTLGVAAYEALAAFLATVFVGFFVLGSLHVIERIFRVTTSMTLLELADMDQPLLRRVAQSAPGTFNHSLQVAVLAEAGADAIGANGLLARVGAYYHDIGKVHKPMYFVENQSGGINRHEKLSPAMSLLIIVGHVKDGVEMAREYGLPKILHHFIDSHHGTTLVEYFYHAAKRTRDERQQPEEFEFRYPGPRPHTREAAVLMICDAAESACRAMSEPTPTRIEQLVHKITEKRLNDGQFDECDITLNELRLARDAITKALISIYHGRVAYPDQKEVKPEPISEPETKLVEERVAG